jgi:hypothetical protein
MNQTKLLLIGLIFLGSFMAGIGVYLATKSNPPQQIVQQDSTPQQTPFVAQKQPEIITKTVTVPATVVWKDTGINVTGKTVTIRRISGLWNSVDDVYDQNGEGVGFYPGTTMNGAKIGELIAKTDSGMARIGTQNTITGSGGINDVPGTYEDNHGELVVEITLR